jgi:hypothetical protein
MNIENCVSVENDRLRVKVSAAQGMPAVDLVDLRNGTAWHSPLLSVEIADRMQERVDRVDQLRLMALDRESRDRLPCYHHHEFAQYW